MSGYCGCINHPEESWIDGWRIRHPELVCSPDAAFEEALEECRTPFKIQVDVATCVFDMAPLDASWIRGSGVGCEPYALRSFFKCGLPDWDRKDREEGLDRKTSTNTPLV